MNQTQRADTGTYVYCVGPADALESGHESFTSVGVGGPEYEVRTLRFEDLAAVVSTAPRVRYGINREHMMAHERVLEEAMTRADVLPVAYGTIATNDQQVCDKLLDREFNRLHAYLGFVRGRVALGVRAHWQQEQLFAEIIAENSEIQELRDFVSNQPEDAAYYERIQLGELTEAAIKTKSQIEADAILAMLEPLVVETRVNETLTDMSILNAAFFVDRDREPAFEAEVQSLAESQQGRITFQLVGPLPPYDFVTISVRWED